MGPGSRWGWKRKVRTGSRWEALRARREGLDLFLVNSGEEQIWSSGGPGRGSSFWLGEGSRKSWWPLPSSNSGFNLDVLCVLGRGTRGTHSLNKENAYVHFVWFWRELNMSKCGKCEAHSWRSMMATDVIVWESNELSCLLSTPVLRRLVFLGPVFLKVGLRSSVSSFWGARLLPPAAPHAVTPSPVSAARGRSPSLPCPPPASVRGLLAQPCREFLSQLSPPNLSRKPLKSKMFS